MRMSRTDFEGLLKLIGLRIVKQNSAVKEFILVQEATWYRRKHFWSQNLKNLVLKRIFTVGEKFSKLEKFYEKLGNVENFRTIVNRV